MTSIHISTRSSRAFRELTFQVTTRTTASVPVGRTLAAVHALLWSDYLCPWCYLARDRTALLESMGVRVTHLPYELHPDIPPDGVAIRAGGRLDRVLDLIGAECAEVGLPFAKPTHTPNTRRVLELAEVVRRTQPDAFTALDDGLFEARWVDGRDLADPDVVEGVARRAGVDVATALELVADGHGAVALDESMAEARKRGVTATPAWWVDDALLIPGAVDRDSMVRWISKMAARREASD